MVLLTTTALYALTTILSLCSASPVALPQTPAPDAGATSQYWMATIQRQGNPAFGNDTSNGYKLFRNVKDFGAVGDGTTDDTVAINAAFSQVTGPGTERCGLGCDSRTTQPALVYFPPGTYLVSKPIIHYYYSQMIGDPLNLPTIKAAATFEGMAVIDADPYTDTGANWHTNQNNFFKMVANFVIDLTAMAPEVGAGIHWQVAQATSLQNIRFVLTKGATEQKGIFMDNGSGGFMTDLTFDCQGGGIGAFLGSQQFTTRNLTFNDCNTAIYVNWDWQWAFKSVTINNAEVGIDMSGGPIATTTGTVNQTVGSVILLDSKIQNSRLGINSSFSEENVPATGGSVLLNNVDFTGTPVAVQAAANEALAGNTLVESWAQGHAYLDGQAVAKVQGDTPAPNKPAGLLGADGAVFERSKPQYETFDVSKFVSIKSKGAKGDGKSTTDVDVIQAALNELADDQILYIDHGAYLITKTLTIPSGKNIKMVGEHWPLFLANGQEFSDATQLKPAIVVGANPGDAGNFEMSNIIVGTAGPVPGATLMQWNLQADKESSGLWDVHFRVAGYQGSDLQLTNCVKNPNATTSADNLREDCVASGLLFHAVKEASNIYVENCWFWVADHELDIFPNTQIDIFNGRGVLIESEGPSWWYGTASEHNVLYNYQLNGAKNVFMTQIQTETPYYQGNPDATIPFTPIEAVNDPDYSSLTEPKAKKALGLRVVDSSDFLLFGGGLYSFFENYAQLCVPTNDCQSNMISIENSTENIHLFGVSTKAAVSMIDFNGESVAQDSDNRNNFAAHVIHYSPSAAGGGAQPENPDEPEQGTPTSVAVPVSTASPVEGTPTAVVPTPDAPAPPADTPQTPTPDAPAPPAVTPEIPVPGTPIPEPSSPETPVEETPVSPGTPYTPSPEDAPVAAPVPDREVAPAPAVSLLPALQSPPATVAPAPAPCGDAPMPATYGKQRR